MAVMFALLLYEMSNKAQKIYQTSLLIPYFLSWVAVSYILNTLLDVDHGMLNKILGLFGHEPILWYNEPKYWPVLLTLTNIVKNVGYNAVIYLAALTGLDSAYFEAAKIDGCSYYTIFTKIIFPLMVPTMITGCIFSFMWRWDDFLGALLYVNKTEKYPVSLALKMFCDPSSSSDYGAMFAMATLSILPAVLIFFCLQRYLVEGISTSGLKG